MVANLKEILTKQLNEWVKNIVYTRWAGLINIMVISPSSKKISHKTIFKGDQSRRTEFVKS